MHGKYTKDRDGVVTGQRCFFIFQLTIGMGPDIIENKNLSVKKGTEEDI